MKRGWLFTAAASATGAGVVVGSSVVLVLVVGVTVILTAPLPDLARRGR